MQFEKLKRYLISNFDTSSSPMNCESHRYLSLFVICHEAINRPAVFSRLYVLKAYHLTLIHLSVPLLTVTTAS